MEERITSQRLLLTHSTAIATTQQLVELSLLIFIEIEVSSGKRRRSEVALSLCVALSLSGSLLMNGLSQGSSPSSQ